MKQFYDPKDDIYYATSSSLPAMSVSVGDHVWLRVDPDNGLVVGIEIENFRDFVEKCPAMAQRLPRKKLLGLF